MPRYTRNMVILAKVETTAGTDAVPVGGTDAVLIANDVTITPLDAQYADRALLLPYFGGSQKLISTFSHKISFSVELAGSGTAATAPQWGDLMIGCAMSEALLATPNRVEYTPASTALKTLTLYCHDDGLLHKFTGAMGNCKLSAKIGETPKLMFDFVGVYNVAAATGNPTATLTAWKTPVPMNKANTVDITIGCTYSLGALTGGTVFTSQGIELDWGNKVAFMAFLNSERVDLTDHDFTGHFDLELTAAQEATALADVVANTVTGLGFTIGTTAGNKIILFAPAMQRTNPTKGNTNGVRTVGFDFNATPVSGNDDIRIVTQ
jgi:hypothetical protein